VASQQQLDTTGAGEQALEIDAPAPRLAEPVLLQIAEARMGQEVLAE
jgi:hypothetical protein